MKFNLSKIIKSRSCFSFYKSGGFILIVIILIGLSLRLYNLGKHDFWFDEAMSIIGSHHLSRYIYDLQSFYYLVLFIWSRLVPESEFFLRLSSVIFSTFSIFMLYKLGKRIFNERIGLLSAFFLSLSPFHIWYAQELRVYSLLFFSVVSYIYFFILALEKSKNKYWGYFTVLSIISIYFSPLTFFLIPAEFAFINFTKYRYSIKKWLYSRLILLFSFLPFTIIFIYQLGIIKEIFWFAKPNFSSLLVTLENFALGYNAEQWAYLVSDFTILIVVIINLYLYIFYAIKFQDHRYGVKFCMLFTFFTMGLIFLVSQVVSIYIDRQLIILLPFYYLLLGLLFCSKKRIVRFFLSLYIGLILLSLYNYYSDYLPSPYIHHQGSYIKKSFKPIVKFLNQDVQKGDIIAYSNPGITFPLSFYFKKQMQLNQKILGNNLKEFYFFLPEAQDAYWRRNFLKRRQETNIVIIEVSEAQLLSFNRIWLISSSWARDGTLDSNSIAVREWMCKNFRRVDERWMNGILIGLYERE